MRASVGSIPASYATTNQMFPKRNQLGNTNLQETRQPTSGTNLTHSNVRTHRKRKQKKSQMTWILMGLVGLVGGLFLLKAYLPKGPVVFCDTWNIKSSPGCTLCPSHGRCSDGELKARARLKLSCNYFTRNVAIPT